MGHFVNTNTNGNLDSILIRFNIQEEKSSGGLQGGEDSSLPYSKDSSLPYSTASSYPTNLSQEGLYDAMAHAYPSLPSSLGSHKYI